METVATTTGLSATTTQRHLRAADHVPAADGVKLFQALLPQPPVRSGGVHRPRALDGLREVFRETVLNIMAMSTSTPMSMCCVVFCFVVLLCCVSFCRVVLY